MKILYALLILSGLIGSSRGQSAYNLVGTGRAIAGTDCYELTADREWQLGAVWYTQKLRLTQTFDLEFTMNFGNRENGADGTVFVLQTVGNTAIGKAGGGMGFDGFAPSFGVEFDIFQNLDLGDPVDDHVAFVRDGQSRHIPGVSILTSASASGDLEDGEDHRVRIIWEPSSRRIAVSVDCVPRISQTIDLVNDVFGGQIEVFWGFTAATGSRTALQKVCLRRDIVKQDTFQLCRGEAIRLVARASSDNQYQWVPSVGLSATNIANPTARLTASQNYVVTYRDRCDKLVRDNVHVRVEVPPTLELGSDRQACEDALPELRGILTGAESRATYRWSTGDTASVLRPKASGTYALTAQTLACRVADSVRVTLHPLPQLQRTAERLCLRDVPVELRAAATGPGLRYRWTPGNQTGPTLLAAAGGGYVVEVRTDFGCAATRQFAVDPDCAPFLFIPDVFTPNGDGANDAFVLQAPEPMDLDVTVFNRWGEVLFRSTSATDAWDGTFQGTGSPAGVYVYRIRYRPRRRAEGPWFDRQGSVLLVR